MANQIKLSPQNDRTLVRSTNWTRVISLEIAPVTEGSTFPPPQKGESEGTTQGEKREESRETR